ARMVKRSRLCSTSSDEGCGAFGPRLCQMQQQDALSIQNVSHSFGSFQALKDVSLTVPRGGFTALLGVNGAGKTTLFSLITRLYDNRSGRIEVAGHDLRRQSGAALRSEELTSELQSRENLVCRLLLEKKKKETTERE